MAAAAAVQTMLPSKLLGSNAPRRSVPHSSEEKQHPKQKEKRFIANFKDSNGSPLPVEKIAEDPKHKQLGHPSRHLQLKDFDLLKTIGTGLQLSPQNHGLELTKNYRRDFRARMASSTGQPIQGRP